MYISFFIFISEMHTLIGFWERNLFTDELDMNVDFFGSPNQEMCPYFFIIELLLILYSFLLTGLRIHVSSVLPLCLFLDLFQQFPFRGRTIRFK